MLMLNKRMEREAVVANTKKNERWYQNLRMTAETERDGLAAKLETGEKTEGFDSP